MAEPALRLRRATPADDGLLADLGGRTFLDAYADEADRAALEAFVSRQFSAEVQGRELADPSVRAVIALLDDVPCGYLYLQDDPPEVPVGGERPIFLSRLYVDRSAQGMGVGRALFEWSLAEARRLGRDVVWLTVWERNPRAIAIYRRWAFQEVGEVRFPFGEETHRDLVMARPVTVE